MARHFSPRWRAIADQTAKGKQMDMPQSYGEAITGLTREYQAQCAENYETYGIKTGESLYQFLRYNRRVSQGEG